MIVRRVDEQHVKTKLGSNCCLLCQKYLVRKFNSMGGNSEDLIVHVMARTATMSI